jgi:uncharacterized membrane protein YkvA (DUF1232 family)
VTVARVLIGIAMAFAFSWLLLLALLMLFRPRGMSVAEAKRLVPDTARLLRDLTKDATMPAAIRRRLSMALLYLALPIDLVPDFIPIIGYADDVIVVGIVLRSVIRRAGSDALERHWRGTPDGLALVKRLAGVKSPEGT